MKTINPIGGMVYKPSLEHYQTFNECVKQKLSRFHSNQSLIYSLDFKKWSKMIQKDSF